MNVKLKKLNNLAQTPKYAMPGDAGMDVVATSCEYNEAMDCWVYGTGLAFEVPEGYVMLIFPRSSNRKKDCFLANSVGVLDSGYRGELMVSFKPRTSDDVRNTLDNIIETYDDNFDEVEDHLQGFYTKPDNEISEGAPYAVGDKVAQIMIIPYPQVSFDEVEELSETERGTGGHGHTGA